MTNILANSVIDFLIAALIVNIVLMVMAFADYLRTKEEYEDFKRKMNLNKEIMTRERKQMEKEYEEYKKLNGGSDKWI